MRRGKNSKANMFRQCLELKNADRKCLFEGAIQSVASRARPSTNHPKKNQVSKKMREVEFTYV